MLNYFILSGRVISKKEPQIKVDRYGRKCIYFGLMHYALKKKENYLCVAIGKLADVIKPFLVRGNVLTIQGRFSKLDKTKTILHVVSFDAYYGNSKDNKRENVFSYSSILGEEEYVAVEDVLEVEEEEDGSTN